MIKPPKATKAPDIRRKSILDWSAGTVTDYDSRRIVDDALKSSVNMVLEQNGVVRPRPSLAKYGQLPGTLLGELFEAKVMEGSTAVFYLIAMIKSGSHSYLYYNNGEDSTWRRPSTKQYDGDAPVHFVQIGEKALIMNGVDPLSYIDLKTWRITTFSPLSNPTATPTLTPAGLSGSGFLVHYAVSANSAIGETAASPAASVTIGTSRDSWDSKTQSVTISWSAVTGATGYNVYAGTTSDGEGKPTMHLLQGNIDPAITSFKDDGTRAINLSRKASEYNSTAGPKVTRGTVVNGRVWLVGDTDNPSYVWYGGDYGYELDFSPAGNGGGYVPIASGTKEVPIAVLPFRRGTGDSSVVVLTQGSNGSGRRFQISSSVISYGDESTVAWIPSEDSGRDGTDSPDAVVTHNNSLFYPSRDGFKTTGTMPSLQNVLSTRTISATIKDQVALLRQQSMEKAVGLVYDGKIYWAVPVGDTENNRIWVYYPDQKGAWMTSWLINAQYMTLYNDNSGNTHFLIVKNSDPIIYELDREGATSDYAGAFETEISSGMVQFSKDGREWSRLIQVVFTFLKPKGEINIEVEAMTEDGKMKYRQSIAPAESSQARGWSEVTNTKPRLVAWSTPGNPEEVTNEYVDVIVEIDEDVQWFAYTISSKKSGVDYKVSSVVAEHVPIGIKDLS